MDSNQIPQRAINLIKEYESLHDGDLKQIGLQPKMDPVGIWTEGYGRAMIDPKTKGHLRGWGNKSRALVMAAIHNQEQAELALTQDVLTLGIYPARKALGLMAFEKLTPNQRGALVSFVYNCGTGVPEYKIFRNIRAWQDGKMSNDDLRIYWESSVIKARNKFGIRVTLPGLVRRRKSEAALFFTT